MTDDRTAPEQDGAQPDDAQPPAPPAAAPAPVPEPGTTQPVAPPQSWPSPPPSWPALPPTSPQPAPVAPPQSWPSPSAPTQPAWGSPAGSAVPGDPGAPDGPAATTPAGVPGPQAGAPVWASPAGPAAYPYGTPAAPAATRAEPVYGPPAGGPAGYGTPQPAWGTAPGGPGHPGGYPGGGYSGAPRRGMSTGKVVGIVVAVAVVLVAVIVLGIGSLIAVGRSDDSAGGSLPTPAPSSDGGQGGQGGQGAQPDPQQTGQGLPSVPATPVPDVPSPTSSAAKAYVTSANTFCRTTTDPALKAAEPLASADFAQYLRASATINRALDARLRQGVPGELKSTVDEITKGWDGLSDNYEKAAQAIAKGDTTAARRYLALAGASNDYGNAVAKKIGMDDCADAGAIGVTGTGSPTPGVTA